LQYNSAQQFTAPPQYNNAQQYNQVPHYNTPHTYNKGNRGGFIGGRGRGRGLVTCNNFQQPGHYARDCPLPPTTCTYCRTKDHNKEYFLTLLTKIQEKRNHNNMNVQWIATEARDDGKQINIVTRGGTKKGEDTMNKNQGQYHWIR
jgi:hypothetical protein